MKDALERSKALFIRRWGEMSGYWGINRTMAELHALLYISAEPLNTDEIMEALGGLPEVHEHCAEWAAETLNMAIEDYLELARIKRKNLT